MLRWEPTPYRKNAADELVDVSGFGRFRIRPERVIGTKKNGYRVWQNNEPIGSIHQTPEAAKSAVESLTQIDAILSSE